MNNLKKNFIKKIFNLGALHANSSNKQKKKVLETIYNEYHYLSIGKSLKLLEDFLLLDINLYEFCSKNSLDKGKIRYNFDKLIKLLKNHTHTKELLEPSSFGIIEIRRWRMYWLKAIEIYKLKNNII